MSFKDFEDFIVAKTSLFLRWRAWRRLVKQHRLRGPAVLLDWLISILTIILAVILINMFVFQNYRIPSESMVPTLLVDDLIFVEKMTFGPEILPGKLKLPSGRLPRRGEVVSFESELYAQDGPIAELAYRFVYFITLSFVNLKTDAGGHPIVDLLIKRVIGLEGERVRVYRGKTEILSACDREWVDERKLLPEEAAREIRAGIGPTDDAERPECEKSPESASSRSGWLKTKLGQYVPAGMFFPMGDNRNNSRDARWYGPVSVNRIQGKAVFRFFPFSRFGRIQ